MKIHRCFVLLAGVALVPRLEAQVAPGQPLTADQVTCEEVQLARLARRVVVDGVASSVFFLWRRGVSGGEYRGFAVPFWRTCPPERDGARCEEQLSFELSLATGLDRLSPSRPLIPQALLSRRESASNLISADRLGFEASLTLDLAPGMVDPFRPRLPLRISNRAGAEYAHADRAGWGIATDGLTEVCHREVTELDEKIFLILTRTMRIEEIPPSGGGQNVTVFRGREPLHYRANVRSYGELCHDDTDTCAYGTGGPVALELVFAQNEAGQLTTGTARILPRCTGDLESEPPGCTSQQTPIVKIYFLPPITPGVETQSQEVLEAAPFLAFPDDFDQPAVTETTIDWSALLANTAWN